MQVVDQWGNHCHRQADVRRVKNMLDIENGVQTQVTVPEWWF